MDELIDGACRLLAGLFLAIAIPAFAIWAVVWGVGWLVSHYWAYIVGALVVVILVVILVVALKAWMVIYSVRADGRRGRRELDKRYQQTAARLNAIARQHPGGTAKVDQTVAGQIMCERRRAQRAASR